MHYHQFMYCFLILFITKIFTFNMTISEILFYISTLKTSLYKPKFSTRFLLIHTEQRDEVDFVGYGKI
jgi:hypothetical protein